MSTVWLITGSGSGLGRAIAEAALDVTDEVQGVAAVQAAVEAFGRLDVLVNNAGYGDRRPFEQIPSHDFQRLIDTCFSGVVYLTRAALPVMRRQRSGHIIQISSLGGRTAWPGNAAYYAAKWAVGGFTEGVALEVAPFGVTLTSLEPGALRTNWGKRAHAGDEPVLPEYEPSVGATIRQLAGYWGNEPGDPAKVAQLVLRLAQADRLPPHILLGSDAVRIAGEADAVRAAAGDRWRAVSTSIDIDAAGPLPPLPTS